MLIIINVLCKEQILNICYSTTVSKVCTIGRDLDVDCHAIVVH